jgi:hypothetical protein
MKDPSKNFNLIVCDRFLVRLDCVGLHFQMIVKPIAKQDGGANTHFIH